MKNLQITQELFFKLFKYHFSDMFELDEKEIIELEKEIKKEIQYKIDKMIMREYYTVYKTAETEQEREAARIKYLDERGIPKDFRW